MSIRDFSELPGDLKIMSNFIGRRSVRVLREVATAIHSEVVYGTPVDTGRARSNWQVSLVEPNDFSIFPYFPGKFLGINEKANASAAIQQGQAVLAQLKEKNLAIWIVNNVLYIGDLNHGSSKQSAGGFVEAAFQVGGEVLNQAEFLP